MTHDESKPRTDASTDDHELDRQDSLAFERRDYLRSLGGIGAAGLLGSTAASSTAAAQSADWEAQADQRIEEHRKSDVEIVARDSDGNPVSDAEVSVEMQEHDFHFGTAVNADLLVNGEDKDGNQVDDATLEKYKRITTDLFNTAVLENAHKWAFWERDQQRADDATQWLLDHDMDIRGHVCIWGRTGVGAIPSDIQTAIENGDAQTIRERTTQHIEDIISHYGDDIMEWEVANEVLHVWEIQKGVYGDKINDSEQWTGEVVPWKSDLFAEWYNTAQDAAPDGVGLCINDFNVLTPEYEYAETWYPNQAKFLMDNGVDLAGMGFQSHMKVTNGEDRRMAPDALMQDLDMFAETVPSLRITEFDFAQSSGSMLTEQDKADYFHKFLKTTFSHPAMEQFMMWGFWDKLHWSPPHAPLFDSNFEKKPGYDVWMDLVFDEWWTSESGTTDGQGTYATDAFLGEHEVTVSTGEGETTETVSVTDASSTTTVEVTVEGDGGSTPDPNGEEIEGKVPQDTDGDGLHEDINANGRLDSDDVVTFFEHKDDAAVTDHVSKYDFNGNSRIDYDDIVSLFKSL